MTIHRECSTICRVCHQPLEVKQFLASEIPGLMQAGLKVKQIGARSIECGASYCHPAHKDVLGHRLFGGYG